MLNNIGPRVDPRGTPDKSILRRLSLPFIFTPFSSFHIRVNKICIHRKTISMKFCNKQIMGNAIIHFRQVHK